MSDEQIARFCTLSNQAKELLNAGIERFNLSARSINKTLKLARTIADLNEHEILEKQDISEALGFRVRF